MASIAKSGQVSLTTSVPPTNCQLSGLYAGEALAAGDACYVKTSDGKIYRSIAGTNLTPPLAPALQAALSGGTVNDGLYTVRITYVDAAGETLASQSSDIATKSTTANQSTINVTSPAAATGATKYKVYISPVNGGPARLQNSTGTNIGTDFTLTAPPVTNTADIPTTDTSGSSTANVVDGFTPSDVPLGEVVTLMWDVNFRYGAGLSPGSFAYLDTVAGGLNDTASAGGLTAIGRVVDTTRIYVQKSY